ncbi:MAG: hypothetical protein IJI53_08800 [Clostridia bacterium]|nr:hypothetical protein [Clostridia bacterium]
MNNTKKRSYELFAGILALILTAVGAGLFLMSFTTGYYIYGQMNSGLITVCIAGALAVEIAAIVLRKKFPDKLWPKFLTYGVTALLAYCAIALLGDRVEAIGTTIMTDYDSGHGGEEAIYYSIGAIALWLIAMIFNIAGSFEKPVESRKGVLGKKILSGILAGVLCLGVVGVTLNMTGVIKLNAPAGKTGTAANAAATVYTVSYNQGNENTDEMPDFQFLCSDFSGMVKADSRFYVDEKLTLDGKGGYQLFVDAYVIESGSRAKIGDDTGLGLVLTTNAEGTYITNADGTVTISAPTHAVFEMQTDTYSSQMKSAAKMNVNGNEADGVYDSKDEPAVLDFVPETTFTLTDGAIVSYKEADPQGTYTVSYNQGNENTDDMPDYQFLCSDFSGMVKADSRFYVDVSLTLDGSENYVLTVDSYVIEAGKRAVIGDDTGLGLVLTTKAEGKYTLNEDGTVTAAPATHAVFEMQTDTYSSQMKSAAKMNVDGNEADGVYDSNDVPAVLDFVPETVFTLGKGKQIVSWQSAAAEEETEPEAEPAAEETPAAEAVDSVTVPSADGATTLTFNADGTYRFFFEAYGVEDLGTYTYENGVLTVINAAGAEMTAEGDPMQLHYVSSINEQLGGDYEIPASALVFSGAAPAEEDTSAAEPVVIPSTDGGTTATFQPDGTFVFDFSAYGIQEIGTWAYADGKLTVNNPNGLEAVAEGDPLALHYVSAASEQLTGDYEVPASALAFGSEVPAEEATETQIEAEPVVIPSTDGGTTATFQPDGTFVFDFSAYGIQEIGTWAYADGKLTVNNPNGLEAVAEGDPLALHYVSAASDMLTGDYEIPADTFTP